MDDDDPPTPELPSVPEPSQKEVSGDSPTQAEFRRIFEPRQARGYNFVAPTEPEVVRPRQQSSPPSPPPSRTVVTRRRSPLPVDESDDEVVMIGESPAPPSYKRLRASAPQQERRVIPRNGTRASPYSVPDTPLRELSRTVSPPTSGSRRTLPRRPSSQSALPEEVRYRLAHLVHGDVRGRTTDPFAHVSRVNPELRGWEDVARHVGARPEDFERVRRWTGKYMREGAKRASDAGIL